MNDFSEKYAFFASANGGDGFKSYFDSVFDSKKFTKVFVLKGGPGTGKSTFMKKIAAIAEKSGLKYEIYRCSSDAKSLDGVIVKNKDASVAILDGTAPHIRDATIPGAVDELIDLGAAWDTSLLESERHRIEELNLKKHNHYKKAYEYLSYSSIFATNIQAELKTSLDHAQIDYVCRRILDSLSDIVSGRCDIKLISSFSKDGYVRLDTLNNASKTIYSIFGEWGEDMMFLSHLAKTAFECGVKFTKFPSPFNESFTEAIFFEEAGVCYIADNSGHVAYDASDFIRWDNRKDSENRFSIMRGSIGTYRSLAQEELSFASDYHFLLEEIYSKAVDFDKVDKIYEITLKKIESALHL